MRGGRSSRPPGARLRAVRRPALRVPNGDRGQNAGEPRLEGLQRSDQGARRRPCRWPGQARRQDLPARSPRLRHRGGDPRGYCHARDRLARAGATADPGQLGRRGLRCGRGIAGRSRTRRTDRGHRPGVRILVAEPLAAEDASVRRGEWKRAEFTGNELRGRTLGIIGLGKIGQAIAARAVAMEMTVLASDPFVTAEGAAHHGVELVAFETILERSDVITVHVPMTRATRGLIGRDQLARMKPGAILLNVARGGVIDEAAVAAALRDGHLGGAGIDGFEQEPPTGSPLLDAPNTVLTPHLGASTPEAQVAVAEEIADQVLDVLAGRNAGYRAKAPLVTP